MHAIMAALVISGNVELWHIYGLAALLGISMSMNQPVRTSIIPELVGKDRMLNAITLNSMAINGTRFIGPAAVAFLIGWQGVGAAYIVSTGMYMLVVMATLRIRLDVVKPLAGTGNMVAQLFEGFRYLAGNRLLLTLVVLGLGPLAIGIAHRSLLPGLVSDVLGQDVEMLGILQSAGAAGAVVAALYLGSRDAHRQPRLHTAGGHRHLRPRLVGNRRLDCPVADHAALYHVCDVPDDIPFSQHHDADGTHTGAPSGAE